MQNYLNLSKNYVRAMSAPAAGYSSPPCSGLRHTKQFGLQPTCNHTVSSRSILKQASAHTTVCFNKKPRADSDETSEYDGNSV